MKYVMLIYKGTALQRQAALPEEEQILTTCQQCLPLPAIKSAAGRDA